MTVSPLERLPRELRDLIYAYALTAPHGLTLKTDENGVGRICERPANHGESVAVSKGTYLVSRLFHYMISACYSLVGYTSDRPCFNQIQYVSHSLYKEAHGLEFQYNTIFFEDYHGVSGGQRCRQVINEVNDREYARHFKASICSSQLCPRAPPDTKYPLSLIDFCRLYPTASIKLHSPLWSQADPGFVLFGLSYSAVVRRKKEAFDRIIRDVAMLSDPEMRVLESLLPSDKVPDNVRLFPCEAQLDKAVLLRACKQAHVLQEGDSSLWIDLAQGWFRNGI